MCWSAGLVLLLLAVTAAQRLQDLTRSDAGDTFTLTTESCGAAECSEHGAGARAQGGAGCSCACPQRAPLFREDRELCVDDLPECSLATFGTGSGVQRIPFVFLPLKGQIIHPSREITFQGVKTPICAVSGAQYLTRKGFVDLRNTLDADVPFSLFRDEGRTFLQWSGEDELRARMSGRVMVVRLLCRDVSSPSPAAYPAPAYPAPAPAPAYPAPAPALAYPAAALDLRGVFTPCVAFRVQGTPPRHISNVTEVQFAPNAHTSEASTTSGLSVTEYVAIGISSLLLGLVYVASVFFYLHLRKRRKASSEESSIKRVKGLKKKDGTAITEHDIIRINNEHTKVASPMVDDDVGVIKKNPLLAMGRQFHDIKGSFPSDSGSNVSDSEDYPEGSSRSDDNRFSNQTVSAVIHPQNQEVKLRENIFDLTHRDESGIERLPDEHVSIVETTEDRDIARPVGTTRRKLYFNPAYFDPDLMAEPPPAALEFLVKIREVIAIAKHKMESKRFQPVLNEIPEEETYPSNGNSIDIYQGLGSQRSGSVVSLKRESSRKKTMPCVGCPGCKSDDSSNIQNYIKYNVPACSNCIHNRGEKQNSIRKWLENIPTLKHQSQYNDCLPNTSQNSRIANSLLSLPNPIQDIKHKVQKQNSFSFTTQLSENFSIPRKSSTISVKSEPEIRNYNLPLPDFDQFECHHKNFYSRTDDMRSLELNDYHPGSANARRQSISNSLHQTLFSNKGVLPDMVNEAIALDHCSKTYNHSSSDEERIYNRILNNATPKSVTRKSSASPAGDYETDSLERSTQKKGNVTPLDYTDIPSSQASPSLSNALPMEEELTMMNAVYKASTTPSPFREINNHQNHYETIAETKLEQKTVPDVESNGKKDYSLVSEVYVNNSYNFGSTPTSPSGSECSMGSRKYRITTDMANVTEEKPGCLTIEVKDPPENYIKIHESDGFEPDTLDRKQQKQKELFENTQISRRNLIEKLNATDNSKSHRIQLRSSGTFKKTNAHSAKFHSLRHAYEQGKPIQDRPIMSTDTFSRSKSLENNDTWDDTTPDWNSEEGRILSLELRHSKRQRQCTPPTIKQMKNLVRPDILPPLPPTDDTPIYEQPSFPPRRVNSETVNIDQSKNVNGRSLSPRTFTRNTTIEHVTSPNSISHISVGSPRCPTRASVSSAHSDYENINTTTSFTDHSKRGDLTRQPSRTSIRRVREINTNTFVKPHNDDSKARSRRRKGPTVDDSGYMSSDSASSRLVPRRIVIPKVVSCSESDDSEHEARSESGAESVETHSVFFGSYRKMQSSESDILDSNNLVIRNSIRKYQPKQLK